MACLELFSDGLKEGARIHKTPLECLVSSYVTGRDSYINIIILLGELSRFIHLNTHDVREEPGTSGHSIQTAYNNYRYLYICICPPAVDLPEVKLISVSHLHMPVYT